MEPLLQQESPFSPHRAFVVQFRTETALEQWHVEGRVEHVVSRPSHAFSLVGGIIRLHGADASDRARAATAENKKGGSA